MELITDKAKLVKLIAGIAGTSKKLDTTIHVCLISLLKHAHDHGDVTLVNRLFDALPKGSRLKVYFTWVEQFSPIKVSRIKATYGHCKVPKGWTADQFDILGAMAITPWDLADPNKGDAAAWDFETLVGFVAKKAAKSLAAGKLTIEQVRGLSDRVAADLVTVQV
jgi:hypothetical protein